MDQNREVFLEGVRQGKMEIREGQNGEQYFFKSNTGMIPCEDLSADLDTLGAAGYYQDGPDMGINVCLEGLSSESEKMVRNLRSIQSKRFDDQESKIKKGDTRWTSVAQGRCQLLQKQTIVKT